MYWLEFGQGLADGLRLMKWEEEAHKIADFQKMAAAAGSGETLRMYIDSVNFHASEESPEDDVLQGPVAVLPTVLVSPLRRKVRRGAGDSNVDEMAVLEAGLDEEVNKAESDIVTTPSMLTKQTTSFQEERRNLLRRRLRMIVTTPSMLMKRWMMTSWERSKQTRCGQMMVQKKRNICGLFA